MNTNRKMSPLEADVQAALSAPDEQLAAWRRKDGIEKFWRGRGYACRVVVLETDDGFVLRSNIGRNGYPPKVRA